MASASDRLLFERACVGWRVFRPLDLTLPGVVGVLFPALFGVDFSASQLDIELSRVDFLGGGNDAFVVFLRFGEGVVGGPSAAMRVAEGRGQDLPGHLSSCMDTIGSFRLPLAPDSQLFELFRSFSFTAKLPRGFFFFATALLSLESPDPHFLKLFDAVGECILSVIEAREAEGAALGECATSPMETETAVLSVEISLARGSLNNVDEFIESSVCHAVSANLELHI